MGGFKEMWLGIGKVSDAFDQLGENKAVKLKHSDDFLNAKDDVKAKKQEVKLSEIKKKELIKKWKNRIKLLHIKVVKRRKAFNDVERIIETGGSIINILPYDKGVDIHCIINNEETNVIV